MSFSAITLGSLLVFAPYAGDEPWNDRIASASRDVLVAADADASGAVYTVGQYSSHLAGERADGRLVNRGGYDVVITRHDSAGYRTWTRALGGRGDDSARAIAVFDDGTHCVGGAFSEVLSGIGTGPERTLRSHGATDGFVFCANNQGHQRSFLRIGGKHADAVTALAALPDGGLAIAGDFSLTAGLSGLSGEVAPMRAVAGRDGFLARLDRLGRLRWLRTFAGPGYESVRALEALDDGGVAAALVHDRGLELPLGEGRVALQGQGGMDVALVKLDRQGEPVWARSIAGSGPETATAVAADAQGRIAVTGTFVRPLRLDGQRLESAGSSDLFFACFDAAGTLLSATSLGGPLSDGALDLVRKDRSWVLAGSFVERIVLGQRKLEDSATGAFVAELDDQGRVLRALQASGAKLEQVTALVPLERSGLVVAGTFNGTLELEGHEQPLRPVGKVDGFVAMLPWARSRIASEVSLRDRLDRPLSPAFQW